MTHVVHPADSAHSSPQREVGSEFCDSSIRAILLPIYWDPTFADRLDTAIALSEELNAHLTCAIAEPAPDFERKVRRVFSPGELERIGKLKANVERRLKPYSFSRSWLFLEDLGSATLERAARLSDLMVLPSQWAISVPKSARPPEIMMRTSIPVLLIPERACFALTRAKVLVAWDGSMAAAAALRAAVPLLRFAQSTHVVTIGQIGRDDPLDPVAYLGWHSIRAAAVSIPRSGKICDAILNEINERGTNLLVMGAYSRFRWIEEVFGGVTESLLQHSPVPILVTH